MIKARFSFAILGFLLAASTSSKAADNRCASVFQTKEPTHEKLAFSDVVDGVVLIDPKEIRQLAEALILTIENNYGPLRIKKDTIGLEWESKKNKLLSTLNKIKTEDDLVLAIADFLTSFNDGHVSVSLPSTLTWTIPLQASFAPAEGKYVVNMIDPALAKSVRSGEVPPVGAIITHINDAKVDDYRKHYGYFNAAGNELTNRALFIRKLFKLTEASGVPLSFMSRDYVKVTYETTDANGNTKSSSVELKYSKAGIGINRLTSELPPPTKPADFMRQLQQGGVAAVPAISRQETDAVVRKLAEMFQDVINVDPKTNLRPIGSPRSEGDVFKIGNLEPLIKLPSDFQRLQLPEALQQALGKDEIVLFGTFKKDGRNVGYLRIPTYSPDANMLSLFPAVDYIVKTLELRSDYLILDQMSNPGGMVAYGDLWVSRLVGKIDPSKHIMFRVKPTDAFLRQFAEIYSILDRVTMMFPEDVRSAILSDVRKQWNIVKQASVERAPLSEPISLLPYFRYLSIVNQFSKPKSTQGELFPEPSALSYPVYTKKIYMLIDHMDFSCGDATPATLSDHGRVTLLGTRTAGAGGTVNQFSLPILPIELKFSLTSSLMYRPSKPQHYVENYGVTPDFVIEPTVRDFTNGYQDFFAKVMAYISKDLGN